MLRRISRNKGFNTSLVLKSYNEGNQLHIGIIDADLLGNGTRHPNLALLKIAGYCKSLNHRVDLIKDYSIFKENNEQDLPYDILVLSKVFKFTTLPKSIEMLIKNKRIYYGGTGFVEFEIDGPKLEDVVEHFKPYYDLYKDFIEWKTDGDEQKKQSHWDDYLNYSIGFATRGCIRQCPFCVNRNSHGVEQWSPIDEFVDEARPRIYLWDDNILAAPYAIFMNVMTELEKTGKPFQFRQGMDIRLMTDEKAELLNHCKYYGDFIFAFDHYKLDDPKEKKHVEQTIRGLEVWRRHTKKSTKLYVLVAFDEIDESDIRGTFYRIKILMEYGCIPYIMRYENYRNSPYKNMYIQLARWCNQPQFFKKMSFRQYCVANQKYHEEHGTHINQYCSCYKTMLDFEKKFPDIAKEFFDLRFEDINQYKM